MKLFSSIWDQSRKFTIVLFSTFLVFPQLFEFSFQGEFKQVSAFQVTLVAGLMIGFGFCYHVRFYQNLFLLPKQSRMNIPYLKLSVRK